MVPDTAGNIVTAAGAELGLIPFGNKPQDPFGSSDSNVGQLCQLLISLGRSLRSEKQWTHLRRTYTLNTVASQGQYALPPDFHRFVDQTQWNRTNRLPVGGPLSAQEFAFLKARLVGVTFNVLSEMLNSNLQLFPDYNTPGNYVIAYDYVSGFWAVPAATTTLLAGLAPSSGMWQPTTAYGALAVVQNAGQWWQGPVGGGTSGAYGPVGVSGTASDGVLAWTWVATSGTDAPAASSDVVQFEPELLKKGLKLLWKREKGLPFGPAEEEYREELRRTKVADTVSSKLRLGGGGAMSDPLIGEANLPYTNFGH